MGRPRIDDDAQWDICKARIHSLYIDKNLNLQQLKDTIANEFDFHPRFITPTLKLNQLLLVICILASPDTMRN